MTALLSAISGQFTKSLVLGTFLPVTVMTAAFLWIVDPPFTATGAVPVAVKVLDKEWQVVLLSLVIVTMAGVLFNLNGSIVRCYSGYPWLDTWFGWFARWRATEGWKRIRDARDASRALGTALEDIAPQPPAVKAFARELTSTRSVLSRELNSRYPYVEERLLPTRLGNVLRNTEEYSTQRFGISGVVLWPRLLAKIDAAYAGFIDNAKTAFDFTLNMSLLAAVSSMLAIWIGIRFDVAWAWQAMLFAALSWLFYEASIARAAAWGDAVKSAVDLYRLPLLAALGYKFEPKSVEEEQEIWRGIAIDCSFPDFPGDHQPYAPEPAAAPAASSATAVTPDVKIQRLHGTRRPSLRPFPEMEVVLELRNAGTVQTDVEVVEIPPKGWAYLKGSVADSGNDFAMIDGGPPALLLKNVAAGATRTVTYRLQSLVP
jgi:hypothetical protein